MAVAEDISQARALLEQAEREADPERETEHLEEAFALLEDAEEATPAERQLIANLRLAYARRFLQRVPQLQAASFETWTFHYNILHALEPEVDRLTKEEPGLATRKRDFLSMWGPEVFAAAEKTRKPA